jgi:class 3 adenylate cyclase
VDPARLIEHGSRAIRAVALACSLCSTGQASAEISSGNERAWADSLFLVFEDQRHSDVATGIELADSLARMMERAGDRCAASRARMFQANFMGRQGKLVEAIALLQAARDVLTSDCPAKMQAEVFTALTTLHLEAGNYVQVDSVVAQALRMPVSTQWTGEQRSGLRMNRGIAHVYAGDLDGGMAAFVEMYQVGKVEGDQVTTEMGLLNMAAVHGMRGEFAKAKPLFMEVLTTARNNPVSDHLFRAYQNLSAVHNDLGDHALASAYLDSAAFEARRTSDLEAETDVTRTKAEVSAKAGEYQRAYGYMQSFVLLRDSMLGIERVRALADVQEKYETEKKAKENATLRATNLEVELDRARVKRIRNILWLGLSFAVVFASVFFLQRNRIAREKARSEELLLNILPEEVAEELKAKGEAQAVQIDLVTVLFTDFKGFTAMSEKVTPKDLVRDLNECFSAFDRITGKYGIEKIKTIGDAYMAAGGLPTPNTTHAVDVINAALEMRDFIAEGKAQKMAAGLPYFEIRIGIHSGTVVAGIVGVKKFQYDIWGDTVNTASRMESSGEVGQVNISEATYALVREQAGTGQVPGLFHFTPRGKVQAKGKGEMEMYFVTNA